MIQIDVKSLKIALVKQEIYQDLYVCPHTEKVSAAILLSSMLRVGPIGLIHDLGADFYIVKEEKNSETQVYRKVIPGIVHYLPLLKTMPINKIPGHERKKPGSPYPNGMFAVDCHQIDWGYYDIVISINISLPTHICQKYPSTLFAYMISEANKATHKVRFGYDVTLNQMARGIVAKHCGEVDFPYTFVNSTTLEDILLSILKRPSRKNGVFMEINSTTERPVTKVPPHFQPLIDAGQKIILHNESIRENLISIYDSKYFVKMGGRTIRGNSVAEAISLGSLAIMDREQIIHGELIIDECNVKSMTDVVNLINRLENDNELYCQLVSKQRVVVEKYFYMNPLQSLCNCLIDKRNSPHHYLWYNKIDDRIFLMYWDLFNLIKKYKDYFFK